MIGGSAMKIRIPFEGEIRTKTRFAFLPIADYQDWYWMELVRVGQVYLEGRWEVDMVVGRSDCDSLRELLEWEMPEDE
jgi:hypothetical protein